ncbi:MAG: Acylamino-acid-releasing enzyme [uncultured Thermomicrobiales bacterium]|uniref:Acylamino-acid-releasing enzyme n=1 Tax=uncultured Thermomicrobiales bacterium TaxID=1645740 RepID=A0A6J4UUR9_9BACT|nr:MAG: Acylamino-acid-releasing enzyme [uncultured Thermomicrobiales bacterium]
MGKGMTTGASGKGLRGITPEDLYRFTYVSDPQLSPDGATVAFVRTTIDREADGYRSQIWVVPSGGEGTPRRFTAGPGDTAPRWSPDGQTLAFLAKRGGAGVGNKAQIWLIGATGGEAWPLTDLPEGASAPEWSPDGARIVCTSQVRAADDRDRDEPTPPTEEGRKKSDVRVIDHLKNRLDGEGFYDDRRRHLFVVPVRGQERGVARQVTAGECNENVPAWSPDGQTLAFVSARHADRDYDNKSDIWTISVGDDGVAEPRRVTRTTGPCSGPVFSPDGATIAYTGHDNAPDSGPSTIAGLWVVPTDGSAAPRNLTAAIDRPVGAGIGTDSRYGTPADRPLWTPDGGGLLCLISDRGDGPLIQIDAANGEVTRVLDGPRQITNASLSADGRRLALAISTATNPADLFACDLDASGAALVERRLTASNAALFAEVAISEHRKHRYTAADGQALDAWVLTPPDFDPARRYPLILEIHGGPQALYGESFYLEFQILAARGYVVLYTNPRGSDGYGQSFVNALRHDWGGVDYRDVIAGLDWLIGEGSVGIDEGRLGVTGGSYGGYLTNWIIGQTERFRAAVSGRSTANRYSHYGHSDIGSFTGDWQFGGPPWENAAHYLERSPITYAPRVTTPLLLESQEQDLRCPIPQAEEFYTAIKKLRRANVQLIRFPGESHGMARGGKPAHRVERLTRIADWFDKYLGVREG